MKYTRKRKNEKRKNKVRKKIIICSILVSTLLGITLFALNQNNYLKTGAQPKEEAEILEDSIEESNQNSVDSEKLENTSEINEETKVLDNSGYLSLEDDINAEDAAYVFENIHGLQKGTKVFPVREDGKKVVYLTFDDGPSSENTGDVLDILNKYGIKATFFVTGKTIGSSDESLILLKRIASEGHAIANHTYSHDYNILYPNRTMNPNAVMEEFRKNEELMKSILGKDFSTRVVRFPGGYWSWEGRTDMRAKLDESGYIFMEWNALNEDSEGRRKNSAELVERTKANVEALGKEADSIVFLMHDTYGKRETVNSLPEIIQYFIDGGFEFKSIK